MRPRHAQGTLTRELPSDELVVMSADGALAVVLNPTGAAIWYLCQGNLELDGIARLICDTLPGGHEAQVLADVTALVARLGESGLLEDVEACGAGSSRS